MSAAYAALGTYKLTLDMENYATTLVDRPLKNTAEKNAHKVDTEGHLLYRLELAWTMRL